MSDFATQLRTAQNAITEAQAEIKVRREQIKELLPQKTKLEEEAQKQHGCSIQELKTKKDELITERDILMTALQEKFDKLLQDDITTN